MDKIYAELVINGIKTFSEIPSILHEKVKNILKDFIAKNIITEEEYNNFIK